jgi:Ankyrin repeats (3 copies)
MWRVVRFTVVMPADELREAIDRGDVSRARELLRAEPALATALIAASDIEPTSPLTYVGMARLYGYADHGRSGELAEVLMQAGADKDDESKNGSPLICAASHGDTAVVRALLDAGADVELFDADAPSDTALRVAAAYGFPEIVDELGLRARLRVARRSRQRTAHHHRRTPRRRHTYRRRSGRPPRHPLGTRTRPIGCRRTPC